MKLQFNRVTKSFDGHLVLDAVTLLLEKVHTLVLIGPSGGGKTTLLRIIAGLESPDSGELEINEQRVVFAEEALLKHRRSVGTVFQAFNLFPHLSALQNITLPLEKVHGHSPSEAAEVARQLLARFRLESHAAKRPAELSGGQRQRIAIARAVAIKPKLLLFDEPTSALDPEMTAEVLDMIKELRDEGRDFILVTHEMGFARQVADQVVVLADGRITESGPAENVFENPQSERSRDFLAKVLRYLPSLSMNFPSPRPSPLVGRGERVSEGRAFATPKRLRPRRRVRGTLKSSWSQSTLNKGFALSMESGLVPPLARQTSFPFLKKTVLWSAQSLDPNRTISRPSLS